MCRAEQIDLAARSTDAVPAPVIPVPLSLSTLTVLSAGVGAAEASAVFVATLAAFVANRSIEALLARRHEPGSVTDRHGDGT